MHVLFVWNYIFVHRKASAIINFNPPFFKILFDSILVVNHFVVCFKYKINFVLFYKWKNLNSQYRISPSLELTFYPEQSSLTKNLLFFYHQLVLLTF